MFVFSEVSEKVLSGSRNGTFVTVSKITLPNRARPEDDGANVRCKAEHPAMLSSEIYPHLEDSGNLSILCKLNIVIYYSLYVEILGKHRNTPSILPL